MLQLRLDAIVPRFFPCGPQEGQKCGRLVMGCSKACKVGGGGGSGLVIYRKGEFGVPAHGNCFESCACFAAEFRCFLYTGILLDPSNFPTWR